MAVWKTTSLILKHFWWVVAFVILIIIVAILSNSNKSITTFTVSGKERQCDSDSDNKVTCYYVVYGRDGEVFQNTDNLIFSKFDSASIQARLIIGNKYTVKTVGYRIPFLSMKPNIISIEE